MIRNWKFGLLGKKNAKKTRDPQIKGLHKGRKVTFEQLENRELLSVTAADIPDVDAAAPIAARAESEAYESALVPDSVLNTTGSSFLVNTNRDVVNANDGVLSLREAIAAAADGDKITFASSLGTTTITVSSTLVIHNSVTIDGGNRITLSANDNCEIMQIGRSSGSASMDVELRNLTFKNGCCASGNGGAIYFSQYGSTLTIKNSSFYDNTAYYRGGAVYFSSSNGTLTISDSTFAGNSAGTQGGAVYMPYGTAKITNTSFSDNSASSDAGALLGSGTISNSSFSGNTASSSAGAVYGQWTISDSSFSKNSVKNYYGGAVYGSGKISNSTFTDNSTTNGSGGVRFELRKFRLLVDQRDNEIGNREEIDETEPQRFGRVFFCDDLLECGNQRG